MLVAVRRLRPASRRAFVFCCLGVMVAWGRVGRAHGAPTPTTAVSVKADHRVPESKRRQGIKAAFVGEGLVVSSCVGTCKEGRAELRLVVPEEFRAWPRQGQVLTLKDGERALWVRYGEEDKNYSFVVLGAEKGDPSAAPLPPELVFRGSSAHGHASLSVVEGKSHQDVYFVGEARSEACGRSIPVETQRLDGQLGKFVAVRLPPLGARERDDAPSISAEPRELGKSDILLRLESSAGTPAFDGDRSAVWRQPYGVNVVSGALPSPDMDWVVELSEPLTQSATLHVDTEKQLYAVRFEPQPGRVYNVALPLDARCWAWVQGAQPLPVVEIMGRVVVDPPPTVAALVARLDSSQPGWTGNALALLGDPARAAVLTAFPRLSPAGKLSAVDTAKLSPWGAPVLALALDLGPEPVREEAARALGSWGDVGARALLARLDHARPESIPLLSELLFSLDEAAGVSAILTGLGAAQRERQRAFRAALTRLFSDAAQRGPFEQRLFPGGEFARMDHRARLGVLTAVPDNYDLSSVQPLVLELVQKADFEAAYQLVSVLAPRANRANPLGAWLGKWLGQAAPADTSAVQRAALRVHILQAARERMSPESARVLGPQVVPLLEDENVRVRGAALDFLTTFPQLAARETVGMLLRKDAWPDVRVSAAAALGAILSKSQVSDPPASSDEKQQELVDVLLKRLKADDDPSVRRAILRAVTELGTKDVQKAIHRRLARDDSYLVRAEAALSLGKLCDHSALGELTEYAQRLAQPGLPEGPVELGLASVRSLARLDPPDLKERLAPLSSKRVPGLLRARVQAELTRGTLVCSRDEG